MSAASGGTSPTGRSPRTFPLVSIAGDGFVLHPLSDRHIDDITTACQDPETLRWLPLPSPYRREHAADFVNEIAPREQAEGGGIVFAIEVDGRLHGCIDLKGTDWASGVAEIGYWVAPWGRGSGLAGRAAARLSEWAIREVGLERIVIRAASGNRASQRAAEVAGFTNEGVARNAGYVRDGRVDLVVYSLIRSDLATR